MPPKPQRKPAQQPPARLFIGNVPQTFDERTLLAALLSMGVVAINPKIMRERATGISRGFGFVEVAGNPVEAVKALENQAVAGRTLRAELAESQTVAGSRREVKRAANARAARKGKAPRARPTAGSPPGAKFSKTSKARDIWAEDRKPPVSGAPAPAGVGAPVVRPYKVSAVYVAGADADARARIPVEKAPRVFRHCDNTPFKGGGRRDG